MNTAQLFRRLRPGKYDAIDIEAHRRGLALKQRQKLKAERAIAAPDQSGKVAACSKCRDWFPSIAARNEHRATAHRGA